jgi:hypothetical protein
LDIGADRIDLVGKIFGIALVLLFLAARVSVSVEDMGYLPSLEQMWGGQGLNTALENFVPLPVWRNRMRASALPGSLDRKGQRKTELVAWPWLVPMCDAIHDIGGRLLRGTMPVGR